MTADARLGTSGAQTRTAERCCKRRNLSRLPRFCKDKALGAGLLLGLVNR